MSVSGLTSYNASRSGPSARRRNERRTRVDQENTLRTVTSKDGTRIAFEQSGEGPAIILVVGAFNDRATGAPLAQFLKPHFTVFNYDRRGRGESGDTPPYAIERGNQDLHPLIAKAGGSACVFRYSSRAILARTEKHTTQL